MWPKNRFDRLSWIFVSILIILYSIGFSIYAISLLNYGIFNKGFLNFVAVVCFGFGILISIVLLVYTEHRQDKIRKQIKIESVAHRVVPEIQTRVQNPT
jgi:hypothetical protein